MIAGVVDALVRSQEERVEARGCRAMKDGIRRQVAASGRLAREMRGDAARPSGFRVSYALSIAKEGKVVLVIQDETNKLIEGTSSSQVSETVQEGRGEVTLTETITIPSAKEVRLFVPLIPAGMQQTEGELVLRFPIEACK